MPGIVDFTANDHYVATNTLITLSWETTNATFIGIDQGIGDTTAISTNGDGSTNIVLAATTTYTLSASNAVGAVATNLTVHVGPARPNLVLIVADDYGLQDTSVPFILTNGVPVSYNFNSYYRTPELENLAADGMRFTTAYAQTVCSPTRCGLMTGRNSARHAVTDWIGGDGDGSAPSPEFWRRDGLDATDITLPMQLQAAGYRTIHVGKWHAAERYTHGEDPRNMGFDVNIAGDRRGAPKSLDILADKGYINYPGYHGMPGLEAYDGTDFLTGVLAIEANREIETAVDLGYPFFLNMCFYAVHSPFTDANPDATHDYSAGAVGVTHNNFATMVEGMDLAIGEIRQKLVDLGVAEDTLIVFLGDNGSDSPALQNNGMPQGVYADFPMRGKKGTQWEGGARVPMIASWAAANPSNDFQTAIPIPTNSIETDIVTSWDVPATLLDAAGLPPTNHFGEDAYSLVPYLMGTPGTHRPQELVIHYPHNHNNSYFSWIRQDDMKLIYNFAGNTHQLYNLANDPTESNDLALSEPETLARMARALAQKLDATWGTAGELKPRIVARDNVVSIPDDPSVDVDGDGIDDTSEDPNLNGLVDSGETDPDNENTDGDATSDGAEVRTGTDPLNPADDFVGAWVPETGGGFAATWPSAPGAYYEIQTSSNLAGWSEAPVATGIPASDPGTNTSYTIPASSDPQRFYRIGLLP